MCSVLPVYERRSIGARTREALGALASFTLRGYLGVTLTAGRTLTYIHERPA